MYTYYKNIDTHKGKEITYLVPVYLIQLGDSFKNMAKETLDKTFLAIDDINKFLSL